AELFMLHVVEITVTVAEVSLTGIEFDAMLESSQQELLNLKNQLLLYTKNKINIRIKSQIGSLMGELMVICKDKKPFAVVMSTASAGALKRLIIGSNTVSSAKKLPYPVLVIPQNSCFRRIQKICLACDLKEIYNVPVD